MLPRLTMMTLAFLLAATVCGAAAWKPGPHVGDLRKAAPPARPPLKSGPQVGESLKGFGARFLNGIHAGQNKCPV
jgi:hypothetical protein